MRNRTIYAAALLTLFAACDKAPEVSLGYENDPDAVIVSASVGALTKTNPFPGVDKDPTKFRAPIGSFLGDEIAISAVNNSDGTIKKTVTYRFDGDYWNPVPVSDYLVWEAGVTYKACYPVEAKGGFTLPDDQRDSQGTGSSEKADYMTGEYACDTKDAIPSDHRLKLTMQRRTALVTIDVDGSRLRDEFVGKDIYTIRVESIQSGMSAINADGSVSGSPVDVKPGPYDTAWNNIAKKGEYHAIVVPCDGDAAAQFLKITVGWRDSSLPSGGDTKEFYVTGRPKFEAGNHYTYKLTIGRNTAKISNVTVEEWGTGEPIDGTYETISDRYSVWDGSVASTFNGGSGDTPESPYHINSAEQLAYFAESVNAGNTYENNYFKLTANIDLNNLDWTPIGATGHRFNGYFDGNGYIITNMSVSDYTDDAGLFGTTRDAEICNVILRNGKVSVAGNQLAALLVARAERGTISNCKVDGSVSSSYKAAGILAEAKGLVNISDCEVDLDCYGGDCAGGIVADGGDAAMSVDIDIKSCVVKGTISSKQHSVGGIAAHLQGCVEISDCVSYADLKCNDILYYSSIGGIVGKLVGGKVTNCTVYSRISSKPCGGNDSVVGGVFGTATDVTISGLKFEGYMDIDKSCNADTDIDYTGYFIGKIQNSITVTDRCTYKKSGSKELRAIGYYPVGVEISKIEAI